MTSQAQRSIAVTGAAGALGQAVARRFLAEGARLALIDRDEDRLRQVFDGTADSAAHLLLAADVTSESAMSDAAARVVERFGRVDAVVHVAGGFEMGEPVHALSRAAWDRMMNLNAWSFVAVSKAFVPPMLREGRGKIVAVSARSAQSGLAAMAAYGASKSALQRLVESLSQEVRAAGLNVNSVAPTIMDTPANRHAMPDADRSAWVSTDVAAQAIAFLCSDAAAAVHGQHVVLGA
ncbi:Dihydroanticapsin 7-dehydrogenase [Burkholderiaceae bacterium]|nr:Dihydroanticapsin 7-dehydrogenase [Burkholderiaceae bacterium]